MNEEQRCKTCAWWREHAPGLGRGTCERINAGGRSPLAVVRSAHVEAVGLNTAAAFGCLEHEPREKWGPR